MSREEAHKFLDRILDTGYCGYFLFNCFKGNITNAELNQTVKNANELVVVSIAV